MRVLFVGPYRQNDGWGCAAQDYLGALLLTGHDVSAKPVYLSTNVSGDISDDIKKAEANQFSERPDVVIQNTLPSAMDYQGGMKNIGLLYLETHNIADTGWIYKMNLMDEIWAGTNSEHIALTGSGLKVPTAKIDMPFNPDRVFLDAKKMEIEDTDDCFIFYFIGEYVERKNEKALSMAFHREFHPTEPVRLILKLHKTGYNPVELQQEVSEHLQVLKTHMGLYEQSYGYIPEFSITDRLTEQEMSELHVLGDCLVIPSRGESFCRPVMDALYMNNNVIVTDQTGMVDTVGIYGLKANSHEAPVLVGNKPIPNLYTSRETWREVDIIDLQRCMRKAYAYRDVTRKLTDRQISRDYILDRFSYSAVASQINKALERACK